MDSNTTKDLLGTSEIKNTDGVLSKNPSLITISSSGSEELVSQTNNTPTQIEFIIDDNSNDNNDRIIELSDGEDVDDLFEELYVRNPSISKSACIDILSDDDNDRGGDDITIIDDSPKTNTGKIILTSDILIKHNSSIEKTQSDELKCSYKGDTNDLSSEESFVLRIESDEDISNENKKSGDDFSYDRLEDNSLDKDSDANNCENMIENIVLNENIDTEFNDDINQHENDPLMIKESVENIDFVPEADKIISNDSEIDSIQICHKDNDKNQQNSDENDGELSGNQEESSANQSDENATNNVEEIRQSLKMQLSCLRTRKKTHVLQPMMTKVVETNLEFNKKIIDEISTDNNEITMKSKTEKNTSSETPRTNTDLATPSTSHETSKEVVNTSKESSVIDEIRKIIRTKKEYNIPKDIPKVNTFVPESRPEIFGKSPAIHENSSKNKTSKENSSSPFVSNTLDEFLTENSTLNVSYKIPKLGAEQGLKKYYSSEDNHPVLIPETPVYTEVKSTPKEPPKFKAKTLAEKRKLIEQNMLKEKRRLEKLQKQQEKQLAEREKTKQSYVLFKDKKIYVKSTKPDFCFAQIGNKRKVEEVKRPESPICVKKPCLLDYLNNMSECYPKIKYKPGPLCRKTKLQLDNKDWSTELRKLPKISLEVVPEVGKQISPDIVHRLPKPDCILNDSLVNFALSVLKDRKKNNIEKETFKFDLPYFNNQENFVVRKKICHENSSYDNNTLKLDSTENDHNSDLKNIINNLINYVETKEIEPHLIKNEEIIEPNKNISNEDEIVTQISDNVSAIVKSVNSQRSRVKSELQRLNCKVVNIEIGEETSKKNCKKEHCKLGCVCQSLQCDSAFFNNHCKKVNCMFNCSCPKSRQSNLGDNKMKLPAGTDILSYETVSQIESKAKKDLAKVEKEFTQTIICTNNEAIVIGSTKPRRQLKAPKKYSEFIEQPPEIKKEKKQNVESQNYDCKVLISRLNLSGIIPYCLEHQLYNCFCGGKAPYTKKRVEKDKVTENIKVAEKVVQKSVVNRKRTVSELISEMENNKKINKLYETPDNITYSSSGRPLKKKRPQIYDEEFFSGEVSPPKVKKLLEHELNENTEVCQRAIPITNLKNNKFDAESIRYIVQSDFIHNITEADLFKIKLNARQSCLTEADIFKLALVTEKRKEMHELVSKQNETQQKRKRKQDLSVCRKDPVEIQDNVKSIFDGEIIVKDPEWLKKLGPKAVQAGYGRLLPYKALVKSYSANNIRIYCCIDNPFKLIITKKGRKTPENCADIRCARIKTKVMSWILDKKLPEKYSEENLSFILAESKNNFEIRGVCTQIFKPPMFEQNEPEEDDRFEEMQEEQSLFSNGDVMSMQHVDMLKQSQMLTVTKCGFESQSFYVKGQLEAQYESIALPNISNKYKWRMITLTEKFAFLKFKITSYSIRYSDMQQLFQLSQKENVTLHVKAELLEEYYNYPLFGMYFVPNVEAVFIGPYPGQFSKDDIEMFYANFVKLKSFDLFKGMIPNSGTWIFQREEVSLKTNKMLEYNGNVSDPLGCELPENLPNDSQLIWHMDKPIYVRNCKPRYPDEFNLFIITNIPNFGYLGAYEDEKGVIEVSWPFERKVLQFVNTEAAIHFLQDRFTQLLQPVPESFKIYVVVLTKIDFTKFKPIDSDFLNGRCIVGEFGIFNFQSLSEEFCLQTVKHSKLEITKLFAKRAQNFLRKKMDDLAALVDIRKVSADYNIPNILEKSINEIKILEKFHRDSVQVVEDLEKQVIDNMNKTHKLISELPTKERNSHSVVLSEIIKIRPNKSHSREVIEISDDEGDVPTSNNTNDDDNDVTLIEEDMVPQQKMIAKVAPFSGTLLNIDQPSTSKQIEPDIIYVEKIGDLEPISDITEDPIAIPTQTREIVQLLRVKPNSCLYPQDVIKDKKQEIIEKEIPQSPKREPKSGQGLKVVKTLDGNFVLVSDKSSQPLKRLKKICTLSKSEVQKKFVITPVKPKTS